MKQIIVLGATGSIGKQTIDVIERFPDSFKLVAASAHTDSAGLSALRMRHPHIRTCMSASDTDVLLRLIAETEADIVVNAIAGAAGLLPSYAALRSGKDLALSNKETIVMAGRLIFDEARRVDKCILPVDSEHAAIFSMIERFGRGAVSELILTASGGAFRDLPLEALPSVRVDDALAHPTWKMGKKITIDCATMANKGLELIEASKLFDAPPERISVVIHPESKVHSLVRTCDGALYAQISKPDMRLPILNALSWPQIHTDDTASLDICASPLVFYKPDYTRYPLLAMAYEALRAGEAYCCAYNAANEEAVYAFINGTIGFSDIACVVDGVLQNAFPSALHTLDEVMDCDRGARAMARRHISN